MKKLLLFPLILLIAGAPTWAMERHASSSENQQGNIKMSVLSKGSTLLFYLFSDGTAELVNLKTTETIKFTNVSDAALTPEGLLIIFKDKTARLINLDYYDII